MRFPDRSLRLWTLVLAPLLASCASSGERSWIELKAEEPALGTILQITGTVHYLEIEGGVFVIRDPEGLQYQPLNLPQAFQVDGMAVEVQAQRRDDVMSIGMAGSIIELLRIRKTGHDPARPGG